MINEYENTPFADNKGVKEILAHIDRLIISAPKIEKIQLTRRQYSILWEAIGEDYKKLITELRRKGRLLYKQEEK